MIFLEFYQYNSTFQSLAFLVLVFLSKIADQTKKFSCNCLVKANIVTLYFQ